MRHINFGLIDADAMSEFGKVIEVRNARHVITEGGTAAFDAIEIDPCRIDGEGDNACCMRCEPADAEFFSVYLHCVAGGVECVGDFATAERARAYARQIADAFAWPITVDRAGDDDTAYEREMSDAESKFRPSER